MSLQHQKLQYYHAEMKDAVTSVVLRAEKERLLRENKEDVQDECQDEIDIRVKRILETSSSEGLCILQ